MTLEAHGCIRAPERTCIGCGRKAPKGHLLRFVACKGGTLEFDPKQTKQGRGGYLCPERRCFQDASKKRRMAVRYRSPIAIDPDGWLEEVRRGLEEELGRRGGLSDPQLDREDGRRGRTPADLKLLGEAYSSLFPGGRFEWPK